MFFEGEIMSSLREGIRTPDNAPFCLLSTFWRSLSINAFEYLLNPRQKNCVQICEKDAEEKRTDYRCEADQQTPNHVPREAVRHEGSSEEQDSGNPRQDENIEATRLFCVSGEIPGHPFEESHGFPFQGEVTGSMHNSGNDQRLQRSAHGREGRADGGLDQVRFQVWRGGRQI